MANSRRTQALKLIQEYQANIVSLEEEEVNLIRIVNVLEELIPQVLVWCLWKTSHSGKHIAGTEEEAQDKLLHLETLLDKLKEGYEILKQEESGIRNNIQDIETRTAPYQTKEQSEVADLKRGLKKDVTQKRVNIEARFSELLQVPETDWKGTCKELFNNVSDLNNALQESSDKLEETEGYIKQLERDFAEKENTLLKKVDDIEKQQENLYRETFRKEQGKIKEDEYEKEVLSSVKGAIKVVKNMKESLTANITQPVSSKTSVPSTASKKDKEVKEIDYETALPSTLKDSKLLLQTKELAPPASDQIPKISHESEIDPVPAVERKFIKTKPLSFTHYSILPGEDEFLELEQDTVVPISKGDQIQERAKAKSIVSIPKQTSKEHMKSGVQLSDQISKIPQESVKESVPAVERKFIKTKPLSFTHYSILPGEDEFLELEQDTVPISKGDQIQEHAKAKSFVSIPKQPSKEHMKSGVQLSDKISKIPQESVKESVPVAERKFIKKTKPLSFTYYSNLPGEDEFLEPEQDTVPISKGDQIQEHAKAKSFVYIPKQPSKEHMKSGVKLSDKISKIPQESVKESVPVAERKFIKKTTPLSFTYYSVLPGEDEFLEPEQDTVPISKGDQIQEHAKAKSFVSIPKQPSKEHMKSGVQLSDKISKIPQESVKESVPVAERKFIKKTTPLSFTYYSVLPGEDEFLEPEKDTVPISKGGQIQEPVSPKSDIQIIENPTKEIRDSLAKPISWECVIVSSEFDESSEVRKKIPEGPKVMLSDILDHNKTLGVDNDITPLTSEDQKPEFDISSKFRKGSVAEPLDETLGVHKDIMLITEKSREESLKNADETTDLERSKVCRGSVAETMPELPKRVKSDISDETSRDEKAKTSLTEQPTKELLTSEDQTTGVDESIKDHKESETNKKSIKETLKPEDQTTDIDVSFKERKESVTKTTLEETKLPTLQIADENDTFGGDKVSTSLHEEPTKEPLKSEDQITDVHDSFKESKESVKKTIPDETKLLTAGISDGNETFRGNKVSTTFPEQPTKELSKSEHQMTDVDESLKVRKESVTKPIPEEPKPVISYIPEDNKIIGVDKVSISLPDQPIKEPLESEDQRTDVDESYKERKASATKATPGETKVVKLDISEENKTLSDKVGMSLSEQPTKESLKSKAQITDLYETSKDPMESVLKPILEEHKKTTIEPVKSGSQLSVPDESSKVRKESTSENPKLVTPGVLDEKETLGDKISTSLPERTTKELVKSESTDLDESSNTRKESLTQPTTEEPKLVTSDNLDESETIGDIVSASLPERTTIEPVKSGALFPDIDESPKVRSVSFAYPITKEPKLVGINIPKEMKSRSQESDTISSEKRKSLDTQFDPVIQKKEKVAIKDKNDTEVIRPPSEDLMVDSPRERTLSSIPKGAAEVTEALSITSEPLDIPSSGVLIQPTESEPDIVKKLTMLKGKPSADSLAAKTLQAKCRVKDHLIKSMADQLRELARNNVWSGNKLNINSDPVKTYDFDQTTLFQYLKGEEPKDFTVSLESNEPYSSKNPLNVKVLKKLDEDSLLIEWGPSPSQDVVGFQIFVNGSFMYWVYSAARNLALLHPLDLSNQIDISVCPVNVDGEIIHTSSMRYTP